MNISATREAGIEQPTLSPTPYGEADANKVLFERLLNAVHVEAQPVAKQGPLVITIPNTFSGQQIIQMFFPGEEIHMRDCEKKSNVLLVSSSCETTFMVPDPPSKWGNPHQAYGVVIDLLTASMMTQAFSSTVLASDFLRITASENISQFLTLPSDASLGHESKVLDSSGPDIYAMKMPRKRVIATFEVDIAAQKLPRRRPHVFLDAVEEDT